MSPQLAAALDPLPGLLASHVLVSAAALALALAISLPLAFAAARRPTLRRIALAIAGLIQTIPGLALLALFYPLLLALSALAGGGIPALGFLPSLLALALYAVLPILRGGVTGLAGIDPAVIEAADGLGMTARERFRLVELPLAAPVLMGGIRTAAVWTIGAATLATTVGQPSLGNLIFAGLQTQNTVLVLVGCIGAAMLALATDGLLGVVEQGLARRRAMRAWIAGGVLLIGIGASLAATLAPTRPAVTIGAKNFSEQYILAQLIGRRLAAAGYAVRYKEGLGSAVAFRALAGGDIDVYVDYAGTLWANEMGRRDVAPRGATIAAIDRWLAARGKGRLVGPLGFENAYALAMRGADARRLHVATIADLAPLAPRLRLASDLEFLDRPEWAAIRDAYGLRFADTRSYAPSFMYRALAGGEADVISAFSSDGRIAADGLTVLADPRGAAPGYDALLLAAPGRARDARFLSALRPLVGAISVERMRAANYSVDRDTNRATPDQAAERLDAELRREPRDRASR